MKIQIARAIFLTALVIMKSILSLMEFKLGKNSSEYKYYKRQVMDSFYTNLTLLFNNLKSDKVLTQCSCGAKLRQGYAPCEFCGGAGFMNSEPESVNL